MSMIDKIKFDIRFNPETEKKFQNEYIEKSKDLVKIGLIVGVILYLSFSLLDFWILPFSKYLAWIVRLIVVIPALFTVYAFSKFKSVYKYHQHILSAISLLAGLGVNAIIAFAKSDELGSKHYYIGVILVIIWTHTFFKLQFRSATIVSILITICYEIIAIFLQDMLSKENLPIFIINNFFLIAANIIGIFASYNLELLSRQSFMNKKKTEIENETNKQKSEEICKQKEEIILANKEFESKKDEFIKQTEKLNHLYTELDQLSIVAKKTDNAIMIADTKGHIEWVNEGFVRLYGYNLDQLYLFKGSNLMDISESPMLKNVIQNGFKENDAITYETLINTKFGDKLWIQTTLTPVINEKREVSKLVAIDSIINNIKNAEAEILKQKNEIEQKSEILREQNGIIEQAFNNMEILNNIGYQIISSLDTKKIVETVYNSINAMMDASIFVIATYNVENNRIEAISAIEKDRTLPFFWWEMDEDCRLAVWCFKNQQQVLVNNHPEDSLYYVPKLLAPKIGDPPSSIIYYPLTLKNKKIGVISVQSFSKNAYTEYHLNIIKNLALYVTIALENASIYKESIQQKEDIQKANIQLEKLSIVASKTDNAVIIADPTGKIEWVNEGFTRLYGYNLDQLSIFLGSNLTNLSTSPILLDIIKNGFKDRDVLSYESLTSTKFGEKLWVQTTLTPITNSAKQVIKLVAIDTNINTRKLAEEEIIRQKDELEVQQNFVMKQGDKIASQNVKIKIQRDLVVKQKKEITDSIHYAQRIQSAILPNNELLNTIFRDFFVFFRPKDIVSGDFYWVNKQDNLTFFAAVDCTGHGVPGAFMSMLGISYFNEIVIEQGITEPADILFRLRNIIISTLHQTGQMGESKDGMDVSLCVLNHKTLELHYAGANNPVYIIRKTAHTQPFQNGHTYRLKHEGIESEYILTSVKADKMPIGVHERDTFPFTNHIIQLKKDDTVYIFSDGFVDQFGGERQKKFLSRNFRDLLMHIQPLNMTDQKAHINQTFEDWKSTLEQVDDVLIIGVKI